MSVYGLVVSKTILCCDIWLVSELLNMIRDLFKGDSELLI